VPRLVNSGLLVTDGATCLAEDVGFHSKVCLSWLTSLSILLFSSVFSSKLLLRMKMKLLTVS